MKSHSHLPQGPGKTESIRKKEQLLYSCEKVPGWPEKGIARFLDTDCSHMYRKFKEAGLNEAGGFFGVRAAFTLVQLSDQMSNMLSATIWSLLLTLFCSPKDPGRNQELCKAGDAMWYAWERGKKANLWLTGHRVDID